MLERLPASFWVHVGWIISAVLLAIYDSDELIHNPSGAFDESPGLKIISTRCVDFFYSTFEPEPLRVVALVEKL